MAGAAGWLAGWRPAGAPAVGHSTGRGRTGAHTANPPPPKLNIPHPTALILQSAHTGFWSSAQKSRVSHLEEGGGMKSSDKEEDGDVVKA